MSVSVDNPFDQLASSPIDAEGKEQTRSRFSKDDIKEQAYQAKEGVKARAVQLQEQVVNSSLFGSVTDKLQSGVQFAKQKAADITGRPELATKSNDAIVEEAKDAAAGEWETVKSRGVKAGKKAVADATDMAQQKMDEKLTPKQKAQLKSGAKQANAGMKEANRQAAGLFSSMTSMWPASMRSLKVWIQRNHLELPAMVFMALFTLWAGLTVIRLVTTFTTPKVPEFDIHDKEASYQWLKYHAGEYKDKAAELGDSLPAKAAKFLANHEVDKLADQARAQAELWREIGMKKLGLAEPSYAEQIWAYATGRPITWQGRVESVLDLAKQGLKATALKQGLQTGAGFLKDAAKAKMGLEEPSLTQRIINKVTGADDSMSGRVKDQAASFGASVVDGLKARIPGFEAKPDPSMLDNLKETLSDGVDSIRSHLPGGAEAVAEAKARAYAATHPSTLDSIKSGAEYVKNRVLHGAQEAAHIAQDRANELADKAKYRTGL